MSTPKRKPPKRIKETPKKKKKEGKAAQAVKKKAPKKPKKDAQIKKQESSQDTEPEERKTSKQIVAGLMKLMPNHPLNSEINDPENDGRQWIIELVFPPGAFVARSIPEPVDVVALDAEMENSVSALRTGEPVQSRYLLFLPYSGGHARRLVEYLTEDIPEPKIPFTNIQLFALEANLRAQ